MRWSLPACPLPEPGSWVGTARVAHTVGTDFPGAADDASDDVRLYLLYIALGMFIFRMYELLARLIYE